MTTLTTEALAPTNNAPIANSSAPNKNLQPSDAQSFSTVALLVATVLSGLFAGFFNTYEISVTEGLALTTDTTYVESFQAINATIRSFGFAVVFFGTVPGVALAAVVTRHRSGPAKWLLRTGGVLAFVVLVITFSIHVPMNNDLALIDATVPDFASSARAEFEGRWNQWHSYRALCAIASFICVATAAALAHTAERDNDC